MKTIRNLVGYLLLLFFCTAFSCSHNDDEPIPVSDIGTPVDQVIVSQSAQVGETITFEVHFTVNNGCGRFKRFSEKVMDKTIVTKLYAKYEGEICHQALVPLKTTYTFTPKATGIYLFRFWQADGKYLDRSITVN